MKLVSFHHDERPAWGRLDGDTVTVAPAQWPSLIDALRSGDAVSSLVDRDGLATLALEDVVLDTPVPRAEKILCIGLNYADHVAEMKRERPAHPVVFTRFADSLTAHGAGLIAPRGSDQFDYEGELAVIIGKAGRSIAVGDADEHVFGYSVFNDGSVRDFQRHTHQFTPGKNFPASGSFGPAIVTKDEIADLSAVGIRTRLNGRTVQESTLASLIFSIPEIVAYVSQWTTLRPGDVIATGTPGGVGGSHTPPLWMYPGDVCEVEIDGIGTLTNTVVEDDAR